jgi:OTU domain-containing protein 7
VSILKPPSKSNHKKMENGSSSQAHQIPKAFQLSRGFSKCQANQDIVKETRAHIQTQLMGLGEQQEPQQSEQQSHHAQPQPDYSFMLPDLNQIDDYKFKEYLNSELIELPTQYALTESGHLNWWSQGAWENVCRPLYPMVTSGDGNCLLHAASLAMWGLHDRHLVLRKALHSALEAIEPSGVSALWRRWKWEQMCENRKFGLVYSDEEWDKEWHALLKLSSYQPRVSNLNTQSSSSSASPSSSTTSSDANHASTAPANVVNFNFIPLF